MTILAIDPGTLRMGYGVVVSHPAMEAVDYGVIALPSSMSIESRLYQMYTHIHNLIAIFRPEAVAIEDPFVGRGERSFPARRWLSGRRRRWCSSALPARAFEICTSTLRPK